MNSRLIKNCENFIHSSFAKEPNLGFDLSQLTIVIPTYSRQEYIFRQASFWRSTGVNLIVVDGSQNPLPSKLREFLNGLGFIQYIHSLLDIDERLNIAGRLISTRYSVMCGDDEFLLPSGLLAAINKLDHHPNFSGIIGQSIRFFLSDGGYKCIYGEGYSTQKYEVMETLPKDRLLFALRKYEAATCYAVMRTAAWKKSWGSVRKWTSPDIIELQHAIKFYILGNLSYVDDVYWMRSCENAPISTEGHRRNLSGLDWWRSKECQQERNEFVLNLSRDLREFQCMTDAQSQEIINEVLEIYFQSQDNKILENGIVYRLRLKFANYVKKILPNSLVLDLQSLKNSLIPNGFSSYGNLSELLGRHISGIAINRALVSDLNYMQIIIKDFYNARL